MDTGFKIGVTCFALIIMCIIFGLGVTVGKSSAQHKALQSGDGYWCPKHGDRNRFHYKQEECKVNE